MRVCAAGNTWRVCSGIPSNQLRIKSQANRGKRKKAVAKGSEQHIMNAPAEPLPLNARQSCQRWPLPVHGCTSSSSLSVFDFEWVSSVRLGIQQNYFNDTVILGITDVRIPVLRNLAEHRFIRKPDDQNVVFVVVSRVHAYLSKHRKMMHHGFYN
jgi:hypothetical protein